MKRRDLTVLRRIAIPAAIVMGLYLLVSTSRMHGALTPGARAYVLCAFAFLFGGVTALAFSSMDDISAWRYRFVPRMAGIAALAAAFFVFLLSARTPVPSWLLIGLSAALTVAVWFPPDVPPPPQKRPDHKGG